MTLVQRDQDTLSEIADKAKAAGDAIRFRVQPQLLDREKNNYRAWLDCVWIGELVDAQAAINLRRGLDTFFRLANLWGPTDLSEYLGQLETESLKQRNEDSRPASGEDAHDGETEARS